MLGLQSYASSSDEESDHEDAATATTNSEPSAPIPDHLLPVDKTHSLSKSIAVCAAPTVVPLGASAVPRTLDPTLKEVTYNPRYEEMYAPVKGPEHPDLTMQQRAPRNTLAGYVEKAHINAFEFENQRRTFHTYGYALDPSVDDQADGQSFVGDLQSAYDDNGKTVFEPPKAKKLRKQEKMIIPRTLRAFWVPGASLKTRCRWQSQMNRSAPNWTSCCLSDISADAFPRISRSRRSRRCTVSLIQ